MTAPLLLLGFALVMSTVGAPRLQRASWPDRSPAMGIVAWQALTVSVLLSVVLAGTALALPTLSITTDLAELLRACALALQAHYATPGGAAVAVSGAVLAVAVVARVAQCLAAGWVRTRRRRTQQRRALEFVARPHGPSDSLVIHHTSPLVYCLPGRGGRVVLTTGTLDTLSGEELAAVLAHERAHLCGRHDLVLAAAGAFAAAFPFVRVFGTAHTQLARLVEMHADDSAVRMSERRVLAKALISLAGAGHPAGTLGAGGESALARVERLARPCRPLGKAARILALMASLSLLAVPVMVAASPAVAAAAMDYCPVGFSM